MFFFIIKCLITDQYNLIELVHNKTLLEEMMSEASQLPNWDLTNVYPGLDSKEFEQATKDMASQVEGLETYLSEKGINPTAEPVIWDQDELARAVAGFLKRADAAQELAGTIRAYLNSFISTDSFNEGAKKALSMLEPLFVRLGQVESVKFMGWIGKIGNQIEGILDQDPLIANHAFYLTNMVEQSVYMMSPAEEELAGELFLSGATAWNKLQGNLTSQLAWDVEMEDGEVKHLPMTAIINLRGNPSETMRRRGYEAELAAWKSVEVPLAAAMNGVKGSQITIFKRRGRKEAVDKSLDQSKIDRETLDAMMGAMKASFPTFRKYFKA